ncbi:MAG: hypothetical protein RIT28_558 [Pseudomonadota bacterium]|jgi:transcriptional regulator with XRE-family HTH domain
MSQNAPIREQVATRLRQLRLERGLSQTALAARVGMREGDISRYETGERSPSIESLERLADGFGLSIAEVMTLNQREPSSDLDVIVSALRNQPNKVIAIARRLVLALLTDPP